MDVAGFVLTGISAAIGASVPVVTFVFWLGGLAEKLKSVTERCQQRAVDHTHHYEAINRHSVEIGKIDTRVVSLEKWRGEHAAGR